MNIDSFLLKVASNKMPGHQLVHKFGTNSSVGTSYVPITQGGVYQTPTTPQALEAVSSDVNDTVGGLGGQTLRIEGLGPNWEYQQAEVSLNGLTPVAVPGTWFRVWRTAITSSGTYADAVTASHYGNVDVQGAGAGVLWARIAIADMPRSSSQIGVFTVPKNYYSFIGSFYIHAAANKTISAFGLVRENADDVTSPYTGVRGAASEFLGVTGAVIVGDVGWRGPFTSPVDIGFVAKNDSGGSPAQVAVDFEILLVAPEHVRVAQEILNAELIT